MSSSPSTLSKIRLIAESGYPNAEVSILNSQYETIRSGVGRLDVSLPCGLYKVQYRAGSAFDEKLIELATQPQLVEVPPPDWSLTTAAPIVGAMPNMWEFRQAAAEMSQNPTVTTAGTGSGILLFVVDTSTDPNPPETAGLPALQLLNFSGELLAEVPQQSGGKKWAGCNVELASGAYLLRIERPGYDALEQTVVASETWQTQVFVPLGYLSSDDKLKFPDLSNAAVLMSHQELGFSPYTQEYAWVEAARQELALGRPIIPEQRIRWSVEDAKFIAQSATNPEIRRQMLRDKFTNPMLGIYAAHLMMMEAKPDLDLLYEVAHNLRLLLGEHPDVIAIELWLDPAITPPPMPYPPMLRSSWAVFVNRSRKYEDLVPSGSYAARIASRRWGTGAWLVWRKPEPLSVPLPTLTEKGAPPSGLMALLTILGFKLLGLGGTETPNLASVLQWAREKTNSTPAAELICTQAKVMDLSELEGRVFAYIVELADQQKFIQRVSENLARTGSFGALAVLYRKVVHSDLYNSVEAEFIKYLSTDDLIKTLGVPRTVVNDASAGLLAKFDAAQRSGELL